MTAVFGMVVDVKAYARRLSAIVDVIREPRGAVTLIMRVMNIQMVHVNVHKTVNRKIEINENY